MQKNVVSYILGYYILENKKSTNRKNIWDAGVPQKNLPLNSESQMKDNIGHQIYRTPLNYSIDIDSIYLKCKVEVIA